MRKPPLNSRASGPPTRQGPRVEPRSGPPSDAWDECDSRPDTSVRSSQRRHRTSAARQHAARWWPAAAGLLLAILILFWFRQPLSQSLWPETRAQQLRADAALALQEGRLTAADGSGARELYEAALAMDPDRMEAREGLAAVGQAALERAHTALAERRLVDAAAAIALARQVTVPTAQTDALTRQLTELQQGSAGFARLLAMADAARQAGRLEGAGNAALPLYQRALALQPNHTAALEGREDTLSDLLQQARRTLGRDELAEAAAAVERVQDADPGHVDLPDVLAEVAAQAQQRIAAADRALQRGELDDALRDYRAALQADEDNIDAAQGLQRVAAAHAARSSRLAADFEFAAARSALEQARAIAPDLAGLIQAEADLLRARQAQSRLGRSQQVSVPAGERRARLTTLLAEATEAEARGDLVTPPGDSAFDKVRAARALAPRDPEVLAASSRLLSAAQTCFEDELRGNRLTRAGACLDALAALGATPGALRTARQRLAQRWVAIGEQRLGASEVAAAIEALGSARRLDPAAPGLEALSERLRAASAAAQ